MEIEQIERITKLADRLDKNTELKKKNVNECRKLKKQNKSEDTVQQNQRTNLGITEALHRIKKCERGRTFEEILIGTSQTWDPSIP